MENETKTRKPPARWRKERARYGPLTRKLIRGGEIQVAVQETKNGLWFWYGLGKNTAGNPTDFETAKAEAMAWFREVERMKDNAS